MEPARNHGTSAKRRDEQSRRVLVHIPQDLPILQVEIEVFAGLLDDLEAVIPLMAEAAE